MRKLLCLAVFIQQSFANDIGLLPEPKTIRCRKVLAFDARGTAEQSAAISNSRLLAPQSATPTNPRFLLGALAIDQNGKQVLILSPYQGIHHDELLRMARMKMGWPRNDIQKIVWVGEMKFDGSHISSANEYSGTYARSLFRGKLYENEIPISNDVGKLEEYLRANMPSYVSPQTKFQHYEKGQPHLNTITDQLPSELNNRHDTNGSIGMAINSVEMMSKGVQLNADDYVAISQGAYNAVKLLATPAQGKPNGVSLLDALPQLIESPPRDLDHNIHILKNFLQRGVQRPISTEEWKQIHAALQQVYDLGFDDRRGLIEVYH